MTTRTRMPRTISTAALAGLLALLHASPSRAQSEVTLEDVLTNKGFHAERSYFSPEPFEHFDTISGNLLLTFTDLVLPGNAGRELRIVRTFNNQSNQVGFGAINLAPSRWQFGLAGIVMRVVERPVTENSNFNTLSGVLATTPSLVMADGSWRRTTYIGMPTIQTAANMEVMSEAFDKYDRQNRVLRHPDGNLCHYDTEGRLFSCNDQFNNSINLTWTDTPEHKVVITQQVGNDTRPITMMLDDDDRVTEMEYNGRHWFYTYDYQYQWSKDITRVVVPEGLEWTFTYDDHSRDGAIQYEWNGVTSITTPNKGIISYQYGELEVCDSSSPPACELRRHLVARYAEGPRGTTSGVWQVVLYAEGATYGQHYSDRTVIVTPTGKYVKYLHVGTTSQWENTLAGGLGIGFRTIYTLTGVQIEQESIEFIDQPVTLGTTVPKIRKRTILRDGKTYSTEYTYDQNNFGDYHHPRRVVETGDLVRTTDYTYLHLTSPWITGVVLSQEVQVGGETFKRRWTYDPEGFKTSDVGWYKPSQTSGGVVTTYTRDGSGNIETKTVSGRPSTSFTYEWGMLKDTQTPLYTVSRTINPDGTIQSETIAGRTTSFEYDGLMRQTHIIPPGGGTPIITVYDNINGATETKSIGNSVLTTTLDGFSKAVRTVDSLGVETHTEYDAEGRVRFESYPFDAMHPEVKTEIQYDLLDRVTYRINPDTTASVRTYGNGYVNTNDEENRGTTQWMDAFGHPDDARVRRVTDATAASWDYQYNALGALTKVIAPGGTERR